MKMLTKENLKTIPSLYSQDGKGENAMAYVKFFTPWSYWTWYATEYNPEEGLFFGKVHGIETEMGYFSLAELESVHGTAGLKIERDGGWTPRPLSECK